MENTTSLARLRVGTAKNIAFGLVEFIVNEKGFLYPKIKETVYQALHFTETEDGKSIEEYRPCDTGARELAEWMIDSVSQYRRAAFAVYVRAKLNNDPIVATAEEKQIFNDALEDVSYQLACLLKHTK